VSRRTGCRKASLAANITRNTNPRREVLRGPVEESAAVFLAAVSSVLLQCRSAAVRMRPSGLVCCCQGRRRVACPGIVEPRPFRDAVRCTLDGLLPDQRLSASRTCASLAHQAWRSRPKMHFRLEHSTGKTQPVLPLARDGRSVGLFLLEPPHASAYFAALLKRQRPKEFIP